MIVMSCLNTCCVAYCNVVTMQKFHLGSGLYKIIRLLAGRVVRFSITACFCYHVMSLEASGTA